MTLTKKDPLAKRKGATRVLILGAYHPQPCIETLWNLKAALIDNGFIKTRLVQDFPDDELFHPTSQDIHFQQKSFHYMERWAQILLFVLQRGCSPMGVLREFARMVEQNPTCGDTAVLLRSQKVSLSSLIKADVEIHQIRAYTYADADELYDLAYAACFNILDSFPEIK